MQSEQTIPSTRRRQLALPYPRYQATLVDAHGGFYRDTFLNPVTAMRWLLDLQVCHGRTSSDLEVLW